MDRMNFSVNFTISKSKMIPFIFTVVTLFFSSYLYIVGNMLGKSYFYSEYVFVIGNVVIKCCDENVATTSTSGVIALNFLLSLLLT